MFKDRVDYIRTLFAPENKAQTAARNSIATDNDRIIIYPEEGKFLQFLIRLSGAKRVVEIGTLAGYSTLWMADALPAGGHIDTIEKDPERADLAAHNLAGHSNITLHRGDALAVLSTLQGPFDMVFIDADKLNYAKYLDWAEQNVRKGGIVAGDNTFLFDAVWKDEPVDRVRDTARQAMRDFNKRLADSARYHGIMLPTAEGFTAAIKLF